MHCRAYQSEMSQCLDGRLSSAARSKLMQHLQSCKTCDQSWSELQEVQNLTQALPQHRVSNQFRQDVWQRIQAGEGSPDSSLAQPVATNTKLRYGLGGAAAAAVFLLGLNFLSQPEPTVLPPELITQNPIDPPTDDDPKDEPALLVEKPPLWERNQLTPAALANRTVGKVQLAARNLRRNSNNLPPQQTALPKVIERDLVVLDQGLRLLERLKQDQFLEFTGNSQQCLTRALTTLENLGRPQDLSQLQKLLGNLNICPLEDLPHNLRFAPRSIRSSDIFFQTLFVFSRKNPEAVQIFVIPLMRIRNLPPTPQSKLRPQLQQDR